MDSYGVYTSIPHEVGVCFWIMGRWDAVLGQITLANSWMFE